MPETINIARIAEKLSNSLFCEFLWERVGPTNINWACEEYERHKTKSHPSDVVFYYDEPYVPSRTYVNCDLKSYARGSINNKSIGDAIESLAKSLSCAEKSEEWKLNYIHGHVPYEICGLLFVYNHDGEYDRDFNNILSKVNHQKLDIPKKSKIVVLGPMEIFWLNNVSYEIVRMRGKGELPSIEKCRFFYPHLFRKKVIQLEAKAATLEMLTAPWITLCYANTCSPESRRGIIVFYRRRGETIEEFLYLIDYLLNYQIFDNNTDIKIKILDADVHSSALFNKAIDRYIDEFNGAITDIKNRLNSIEYNSIQYIQTSFSELEIGMENV